jgi:hypothetical protein
MSLHYRAGVLRQMPLREPLRTSGTSATSRLPRGAAIEFLGTSQLLISRVHPSNKTLLIGNLEQESCKGVALLLTKTGEQCVLMFPHHLPDLLQYLVAVFGQLNGVQAPVMRVCSPLHQAPFLQVVQYGHKTAGMNLQPASKLLLARPSLDTKQAQNSRICRRELQNPQSFSKLRPGMRSKLGKQERRLF